MAIAEFNDSRSSVPWASFLNESVQSVSREGWLNETPIAKENTFDLQQRIIVDVFGGNPNLTDYLNESCQHIDHSGTTRFELLIQYTTAQLARRFAEIEQALYKNGGMQFYVHDAGQEIPKLAVLSNLDSQDGLFPYYRAQTEAIHWGCTIQGLLAQDLHKEGDPHSGSRQLGGHISVPDKNIAPVSSMTAINLLPSVGAAKAIKYREYFPTRTWEHFSKVDAIIVATAGEASLNQGEASSAMHQAVLDQVPWLLVVMNNGSGISMGLGDTAVNDDPIILARGMQGDKLRISDVSAQNLPQLFSTARECVQHVRTSRRPAILHVYDVPKITGHTSSGEEKMYIPQSILDHRKKMDSLPIFEDFLVKTQIVTQDELDAMKKRISKEIETALKEVKDRPAEDPKKIYNHVYPDAISLTSMQLCPEAPSTPEVDVVGSTRRSDVTYTDGKTESNFVLKMRQHLTLAIARAMQKYPEIILFGEDVADLSRYYWNDLDSYFKDRQLHLPSDRYSEEEIQTAYEGLKMVYEGHGHELDPQTFGILADIMQGKGGVFANSQFLQFMFGYERVHNSPLSEERIAGLFNGLSMGGFVPLGEIQFGSYASPATQQINDYGSSIRWRSNGRWKKAGGIYLINSMGRVGGNGIDHPGGVGGIGHFDAWISRFHTPGLINVIPGGATEIGPLFNEAAYYAVNHGQQFLFWVPINMLNTTKGFDQGADAYMAINEVEIHRTGKNLDMHIVTWSNNVQIADYVADELSRDYNINIGIINLRSLTPNWPEVLNELKKSGKILIFEAGRGYDSSLIHSVISQNLYPFTDGAVKILHGKQVPTPAGRENEAFAVPQAQNLYDKCLEIVRE